MANEVKKRVAKEFITEVVPATPVKTGRARSNWNASVGSADFSTRETEGTSGDAAIQRAVRNINRALPGQPVFVTNGLPYIQRLNDGYSSQAPAGYIDRAVDAASASFKRIRFSELRKAIRNG